MKKSIINSAIGLTTAYLITIILHEVAHYLMSVSLGYEATLFHNRVWTSGNQIRIHEIMIAGVGPLFSLLQGVLAYHYSKKIKTSPVSLFVLWFGIAGIITFLGYLMIAPLIPIGDTGKVFKLLNIPIVVQVIISILSVVVITKFLMKSTKTFEKYAIENYGSIKENRKKWSMSLILFPLIISIITVTGLQFPIPHFISVLATTSAPFAIMAVFGTFIGKKEEIQRDLNGESINSKISKSLVFLFTLTIIINRLLVHGI